MTGPEQKPNAPIGTNCAIEVIAGPSLPSRSLGMPK